MKIRNLAVILCALTSVTYAQDTQVKKEELRVSINPGPNYYQRFRYSEFGLPPVVNQAHTAKDFLRNSEGGFNLSYADAEAPHTASYPSFFQMDVGASESSPKYKKFVDGNKCIQKIKRIVEEANKNIPESIKIKDIIFPNYFEIRGSRDTSKKFFKDEKATKQIFPHYKDAVAIDDHNLNNLHVGYTKKGFNHQLSAGLILRADDTLTEKEFLIGISGNLQGPFVMDDEMLFSIPYMMKSEEAQKSRMAYSKNQQGEISEEFFQGSICDLSEEKLEEHVMDMIAAHVIHYAKDNTNMLGSKPVYEGVLLPTIVNSSRDSEPSSVGSFLNNLKKAGSKTKSN